MLKRVSFPMGRKAALPFSSTRRLASLSRYLRMVFRMVFVWLGVSFWAMPAVEARVNASAAMVVLTIFGRRCSKGLNLVGCGFVTEEQ